MHRTQQQEIISSPIQRTHRALALIVLLALSLVSTACRSKPEPSQELRELPPAPYRALLVFSARSVEKEKALTPLWERLAGLLEWYHTFAEVDWIPAHRIRESALAQRTDEGTVLRQLASQRDFDRVVFLWLDTGDVEDEGPNLHAIGSSTGWLLLGFPALFFGDRSYRGGFTVGADVEALDGDLQRPNPVPIELPDINLTLLDRGFSWWFVIVPPFLLEGDPEEWSKIADEVAEDQLVRILVERFKTEPLEPTDVRFQFTRNLVGPEGDNASIAFVVESDLPIRRVELIVDGATLGQWSSSGLEDKRNDLPGGGWSYGFEYSVPLESIKTVVRVLAFTDDLKRTGTLILRKEGEA